MDINKIIKKYEHNKNAVEVLQDIQKEFGYLSRENLETVSNKLGMPLVELYGVATFYTQFKDKPEGKYKISICRGTACHVKKSDGLLEHLQKKLNVDPGETTKDRLFTLECVNCIGACAKAPAMMINDVVHGNLTVEKLDEVLAELK